LRATFHPAGTILASTGWERRTWLWDPVLGRPWLNLTGWMDSGFSRDGRIVVSLEDKLTPYQVDPALEYRTFAHVSREPNAYEHASIRGDGRILAVGTGQGVVFWDLARGTELTFLPIGNAEHLKFEPSGDLLTSGSFGVLRWSIELDSGHGEFRIGPPHRLALPPSLGGIDQDRSGRIVALAHFRDAYVLTRERALVVGPLDDCRYVAVSPDGEWLATGSYGKNGAQVWRLRDATQVAHLAIEGYIGVAFSPDGKWLMTKDAPCRLWEVGTWREAPQKIGGWGHCFSPDGRQLVVQDSDKILRLVETETAHTLARLESPDLCAVHRATFSPDGSRLVVTTNDGPAVHVWDLRAIRRHLVDLGLDWDAPAYTEPDPVTENGPPSPLKIVVDMGALSASSGEVRSLLQQAQRFPQAGQIGEAIGMLRQAVRLSPDLAEIQNNLAWLLVTAPEPLRSPTEAIEHARRAAQLAPGENLYLNTLGVALYRTGSFAKAVQTLEKSLEAGKGRFAAFDLFFLAMAHHRLGHREEARSCFDRAVRWLAEQKGLNEQYAKELAAFRAEAEAVLASPSGELPADVFAPE
jgi:WD40 repeat protein/Tfp pilus assembly protein PilF